MKNKIKKIYFFLSFFLESIAKDANIVIGIITNRINNSIKEKVFEGDGDTNICEVPDCFCGELRITNSLYLYSSKFTTKGISHPAYSLNIETAFLTNSSLKVAFSGMNNVASPLLYEKLLTFIVML
jgi:hypothetical protein